MVNFDADHPLTGHLRSPIHTSSLETRQNGQSRPGCGSGTNKLHYNTPLHFIALVIILVLSTVACSFPIIARRFPSFPVPHRFLFLSRHFGTGVLIATAFVHLLPTAFISLTDPCLPPFWNEGYPAMAGFIALMSVLVVVGVEMFFATRGAGHVHSSEYGMIDQDARTSNVDLPGVNGKAKASTGRPHALKHFRHHSSHVSDPVEDDVLYDAATSKRNDEDDAEAYVLSSPSDEEACYDRAATGSDIDGLDSPGSSSSAQHTRTANGIRASPRQSHDAGDYENNDDNPRPRGQVNGPTGAKDKPCVQSEDQKMLLQCLLLEAGILFHSVFIGMALSVATGTSFVVLLVAISFHQTFEGLALGSRIAAITAFGPRSAKPWLMALAYGTTTPLGQAIGLGVHNLYDPESEVGLIMVGVFNSMSSGLLLFAGLVELLAADFLSDESYQTLRGRKRLEASGAVVAGALLMALVGAWA